MAEEIIRMSYKIAVILLIVLLMFPNFNLAQGYDLSYDDVQGDVVDSKTGQTRSSGYEHIDILQISSMELESILNPQLVFQITVVGVITNSDDITYTLFILDGEEAVYYITYSNGIATGVNVKDDSMDILQATGTGTNTLEISVQLSDVGEVADYDFGSITMEYLEAEDRYFLDTAGNSDLTPGDIGDISIYQEMPVSIVDPKFGATLSKTRTVKGITSSQFEMQSVELQTDSKSNDGWILTSTTDDWGNWSYDLDTSFLSDGRHKLHVRALNGSEYFFDTVEFYINSENVEDPESTGMPKISVGDRFEYEITIDIPDIVGSIGYSSLGFTNLTIIGLEDVVVGGSSHEAFIIEIEGSQYYDIGNTSYYLTQQGFDWLRSSDLASIKSEIETTTFFEDGEETITNTNKVTVKYNPPLDKYDFPISVGNTWSKPCTISYDYESESDNLKETFEGPFEFEALHKKTMVTPAGSFETFLLWSQDYFSTGDGVACNWEYHSPQLGFPVKTESYDNFRNLYYTSELVSYEKIKEDEPEDSGLFGGEDSNLIWLILILVVIVLVSILIMAKRKKNSRYSSSDKWQELRPIKPSVSSLKPSDSAQRSPLKFVKCQRCSQLISIEKGEQLIRCPYCGLIQNI